MVIGGDTEVVLDGRVLGKPSDAREARDYLLRLSGREHEVLGGVAVIGPDHDGCARNAPASPSQRSASAPSTSRSSMPISPREEWRGRAGGYAIQGLGSALVEAVRGDLSNVIGLPVPLLAELAPELFTQGRHL